MGSHRRAVNRGGVGQLWTKGDPSGAMRGIDWRREATGGQRGWVRSQGESTSTEPGWDHGDGEEGTGRGQGSGGTGLETDRLEEAEGGTDDSGSGLVTGWTVGNLGKEGV